MLNMLGEGDKIMMMMMMIMIMNVEYAGTGVR